MWLALMRGNLLHNNENPIHEMFEREKSILTDGEVTLYLRIAWWTPPFELMVTTETYARWGDKIINTQALLQEVPQGANLFSITNISNIYSIPQKEINNKYLSLVTSLYLISTKISLSNITILVMSSNAFSLTNLKFLSLTEIKFQKTNPNSGLQPPLPAIFFAIPLCFWQVTYSVYQ